MSLRGTYSPPTPDQIAFGRKLIRLAILMSFLILLMIILMRYITIEVSYDLSFLPMIHAQLNTLAALSLVLAYRSIRKLNIIAHRQWIYVAFTLSCLFLMSYVIYHTTNDPVLYQGYGWDRYVYFFLLITHIILAALILPFIFFTFIYAYTGQYLKHTRYSRWVFPAWLYVTITGPICYLMLYS